MRSIYLRNTMILLFALITFSFNDKAGGWQLSEEQEWTLLKEVDGVSFYSTLGTCENNKSIILKIENHNSKEAQLNWTLKVKGAEGSEDKTFTGYYSNFKPNLVQEGECQSVALGGLVYRLSESHTQSLISIEAQVTFID